MTADDLASYTVALVKKDQNGIPEELKGIPFLAEFLQSADTISAFYIDRVMRRYVYDLLCSGSFEIISPRTGTVVRSGSSLVLNDKSVFYSFPDEPDLLVGVGNLASGFPITAAIIRSEKVMITTGDPVWGIGGQHLRNLQSIICNLEWKPETSAEIPVVVSGDANFAHHAWNQLPSLIAISELYSRFSIVSTHEPIGPLDDLIPALGTTDIERVPASWLERLNGARRIFVPLGSTLLTSKARTFILDYCKESISAAAAAAIAKLDTAHRHTLWISVRTRNRTLTNQVEFIKGVCARFVKEYEDCLIILDGHSVQSDLYTNSGSYDVRATEITIAADLAEARAVTTDISDDKVLFAIGLKIGDSLTLAQQASFYVCHHGTVQHKIGWFSPTYGFIHANKLITQTHPAKWVSSQSEIAKVPRYIPEHLIVDEAIPSGDAQQQALRTQNYALADMAAGINLILDESSRVFKKKSNV